MKTHRAMWIAAAALLLGTGCVSMLPPVQLLSARGACRRAESSAAARFAPVELQRAKAALSVAEASFAVYGDVERTRDLAYVARRKAQLAAVVGDSVALQMARDGATSSLRTDDAASVTR